MINKKRACYVIAEAGLNHNGDLGIAREMIKLAAIAGADAVKFQKRDVDNLAISSTLDAVDARFPSFGKTYKKIREFLEFGEYEYRELRSLAKSLDLDFIVTAFDVSSFEFLMELGVDAVKFASHSLTNIPLLERAAQSDCEFILSTGMAEQIEIDEAVATFEAAGSADRLTLLHCVSSYPTPDEECNLRVMDALADKFLPKVKAIGYSGHELGYLPTLIAVGRGATVIERHYTLDTDMEGFDHKMSLGPGQMVDMIKDIRRIEDILGSQTKKLLSVENKTRDKYHVSWVSAVPIEKGQIISRDMLCLKNPGTGLGYRQLHLVEGQVASCDIPCDVLIDLSMLADRA